MATASYEDVLVGFVCPICKTNFESAELLVAHYATHEHDDSEPVCYQRVASSAELKSTSHDGAFGASSENQSSFTISERDSASRFTTGRSINKIYDNKIELRTNSYDRLIRGTSEIRRPATISEPDAAHKFDIGSSMKKIFGKAIEFRTTTLGRVFAGTSENRRPITISEAELRTKDLLELFNGKTDKEKVKLIFRSHTDHFIELRSAKKINQLRETDMILENLEKYLKNEKPERSLWKKLENEADSETATNVCSECKRHFKLLRRRHNCKLCETPLCDACSVYVEAKAIGSILIKPEVAEHNTVKPLRHCKNCRKQLEVMKSRSGEERQVTKLNETYKELQNLKRQLTKTVITYKEIHESLVKGKTIHNLSHAAMVRDHIGQRGREIAVLGKLIGEMPVEDGSRQAKVYATIEKASNDFMMELMALPKVPTAEAVEEARLRRISNSSVRSRRKSGLEWDEL